MILDDYIYGTFEVEPELQEIIETKEMQRLKGVYQGGASVLVNKEWNVTRYEHSVGTMLLIRLLNGCIEEQIAGLIHDISHTAFSHVIDLVLDKKDEDYHESIFEKKAPKLCANRVDYTLRDMYKYGKINNKDIDKFIKSLQVVNDEIVINSIEMAEWFVSIYNCEVGEYFMNPRNLYAYDKLSQAIKISLKLGELRKEDFLKEDKNIIAVLRNSKSKNVNSIITELNTSLRVVENKVDFDIHKTTKLRFINPTIIVDDKCIESSKLSNNIHKMNIELKEKLKNGVHIKKIEKGI